MDSIAERFTDLIRAFGTSTAMHCIPRTTICINYIEEFNCIHGGSRMYERTLFMKHCPLFAIIIVPNSYAYEIKLGRDDFHDSIMAW